MLQKDDGSERRERLTLVLAMSDSQFKEFVCEQMQMYETDIREQKELLSQNTALTIEIAQSTKDIVDAFKTTRNLAQTVSMIGGWISTLAKWATPIIVFVGTIWAIMHGKWPHGD